MTEKLDSFDLKILAELQANGGLSNQELADRVGLSPSPCSRRIRDLEHAGVIRERVVRLEPRAVGLDLTVLIHIRMDRHTPERFAQFEGVVGGFPEVLECYLMTGPRDYWLRVVVPDIQGYDTFYKKLIATVPLKNVTSRFAMEKIKSTTSLPIP